MNNAELEAIKQAKAQSNGNGKRKKQSQVNAEAASGTVSSKIDQITDKLAGNLTKQIYGLALQKTLNNLASGNIDEFAESLFDALDQGLNAPLEAAYTQLKSWDEDPKFLLPSGKLEP